MRERRAVLFAATLATSWLVLFVCLDLAFRGPNIVFVGLFGVSALIASAVLPPWATSAFGVVAVGLSVWAGRWDHIFGSANHWVRVFNVGVVGVASVVVASVREHREERLRRVEAIAEAAQRAMLPSVPPRLGELRVAARYRSAQVGAQIGGDFYDAFAHADSVRFVLGDVRGKGLPAVQHAAHVMRLFRQSAEQPDLAVAAGEINEGIKPALSDEDFVTAILAEYAGGKMTFVSCGHHAPYLVLDGTVRQIDTGEEFSPLGLATEFGPTTLEFPPTARLLLFTDGLIESRNPAGEFLPEEHIVTAIRSGTLDAALDALETAALRHVGQGALGDDLALLLVERVG